MSFDAPSLLKLLPAVYASRDAALAQTSPGLLAPAEKAELASLSAREVSGPALSPAEVDRLAALRQQALAGPLASLLAVIAEQFGVLEEDLAQLLDDQFIETCAEYLVPYIGDLIGVRGLHDVGGGIGRARAEVAHTLGYRRRKGTVPVLEGIAFDVTGWPAAAAEFFQRLIVTQYANHRRLHIHAAPDLRRWETLQHIGTAFDTIPRCIDVRRIASGRGRHNIPNVGVFLWRLQACALSGSPAVRVGPRRWRFSPLGVDAPLFTLPDTRDERSGALTVPTPIARRMLDAHRANYYPEPGDARAPSFALYIDDRSGSGFQRVAQQNILASHLGDSGATWGNLPPAGKFAVDPELGRIALPNGLPADVGVRVDFHYGFSAELGGGEYERVVGGDDAAPSPQIARVPAQHATIAAALTALNGSGVVEIGDSGRYEENISLDVAADATVEIRAANGHRPTLVLGQVMRLRGAAGSGVRLDGLLIVGDGLRVPASANNALARLELAHCTLVPGLSLAPDLAPQFPQDASLVAELPVLTIDAQRCILGALRVEPQASVTLTDCILDATAPDQVLYAGLNSKSEGARLSVAECTLVGRVNARRIDASNCIFLCTPAQSGDWRAPVKVQRRQEGCVRYCWIPPQSRTPSRFQCLPESADSPAEATPQFTSLRYGHPGYAQLAVSSGARLLVGADDESEPGALHHLHAAQRQTNLRVRLDEYLRAGLEAGIFYEN